MPEQSLKINASTSVAQLSEFFQGLDKNSQVRARKSGENIVLYVRGSSKLHVLTDMLRLGFFVKRDYEAARETITNIFSNSKVGVKTRTNEIKGTSEFNETTSKHRHDFYTKDIKLQLETLSTMAAHRSRDLTLLKQSYQAIPEKIKDSIAQFQTNLGSWPTVFTDASLNDFASFAQICHLDTHLSFDIYNYEKILNLADQVLQHLSTPGNNAQKPKNPNYKKNESNESNEQTMREFLIEFAKQIKISTAIQLSNIPLKKSEGDLMIFDPTSGDSMTNIVDDSVFKTNVKRSEDDALPIFSISNSTGSQEKRSLKINDVLQLEFEELMGDPSKEDFDRLYDEVGKMISKKINNKKDKRSDDSKGEVSASQEAYVVHLTVLTPFRHLSGMAGRLTSEQKEMALDAFARGTSKWRRENPGLRIHVHGSRFIGIPDIAAY